MSGWGDNPFENNDKFDENATNPFTEQGSGAASPAPVSPNSPKRGPTKKKSKKKGDNGSKGLGDTTNFTDNAYDKRDERNAFAADAERFASQVDESDIDRRERELQARESKLAEREQEASYKAKMNTPNYPPFPKFCCIKPWVVHYIKEDIPDSFRRQQSGYFIYFNCWIVLMWLNIVGCSIQFKVTDIDSSRFPLEDPLVSLILSIVYAVFLVPVGFYLRYWSLFKAVKNRSSIRMIFHLLMELVNAGWSAMLASGVWKTGGAGFEGAIVLKDYGMSFGATWLFISGGLFLLDSIFSLVCFVYFWYFWRNGGLKFSDATAEAATGIASNKTVQRAAANGARQGLASQFPA